MTKDDIKVGGTYVGKNGRKRRVVSEGGIVWQHQTDRDTINYVDANAGVTAREKNMTRASFASWAVSKA